MPTDLDRYSKVIKEVNSENLNLKLDSPEKLNHLLCNINKFVTKRLEDSDGADCMKWFLITMKKYKVLLTVMSLYSKNTSTYKEEIIKKLNTYSYKTISQIIDEALMKKYLIYKEHINGSDNKTKLIVPSVELLSAYINWNLKHIYNYSKAVKNITK
jgi:hypothetical protein